MGQRSDAIVAAFVALACLCFAPAIAAWLIGLCVVLADLNRHCPSPAALHILLGGVAACLDFDTRPGVGSARLGAPRPCRRRSSGPLDLARLRRRRSRRPLERVPCRRICLYRPRVAGSLSLGHWRRRDISCSAAGAGRHGAFRLGRGDARRRSPPALTRSSKCICIQWIQNR